jgi:starch-binding outer membrane protein SusE/F
MKKIKFIMLLILSSLTFFSCKDDETVKINNDAASGKISFVLNKPAYSNYVLENINASSTMDSITCIQPNYGFTAPVTYTTQVSLGSTFAEGTYTELATRGTTGQKVGINTKEMNKALITLNNGAFSEPLPNKTVYVRLKAVISSATISATDDSLQVKPLYSNAISLKIKPYIEPLDYYYNVTTLRPWYIVGLGGKWDNSVPGLGSSLIPLGVIDGKAYDPGTGDGTFAATVYIKSSDSFKLIRDVSSWSPSWAMTAGTYTYNGSDNITVATNGWYKITLNSIDSKLTIAAATAPTSNYASIGLIGAFNNWAADVNLTANTNAGSHVWYTTYTFAADSQCKLRANGNWDTNWGAQGSSDGNPLYSKAGITGGKNMLETAGTYTVIFNDIDGSYYFIKK